MKFWQSAYESISNSWSIIDDDGKFICTFLTEEQADQIKRAHNVEIVKHIEDEKQKRAAR